MMSLSEVIELIDPNMEGNAWLQFIDEHGELQCKANTMSSFLTPMKHRRVLQIDAADKNLFNVYLEGEI